jgi:glutamate synthase (NADPH/NADH) small chain
MEQEGVCFKTKVHVGVDISAKKLSADFDALVLAGGAQQPRDLPVPGRELKGIHFAMEYLTQQNRMNLGAVVKPEDRISARGKKVIVIGGGDTGSDCVGTANRQGAVLVKNFELLPRPPNSRASDNPWPSWALIERTSTSHEEGVDRDYGILTKGFSGKDGMVKKLKAIRLEFGEKEPETGRRPMKEVPGSDIEFEADLVLLAMGFLGPVKKGLLEEFGVDMDERGNVKTGVNKMTNIPGVFAAGDMRRGQSLVVWAIQEGRSAAEGVHQYLSQQSVV